MTSMTCVRNKSLGIPPEEEKQGIISILGSDGSRKTKPPAAASLRRTLSADMSSKKWLAQNGFINPPVMKRVASSAQLSVSYSNSSSDKEAEPSYGKKLDQNPKRDDVWSSIIAQKTNQELPPPYVHPLVKKSSSSLSRKSLEICTESLGSETGSDRFSWSEAGSEANGSGKVDVLSEQQVPQDKENSQSSSDSEELPAVAKYNHLATSSKKLQARPFPPPIPLLAANSEGPSLHMHSHRQNGRLVLEAVSVPSSKNFHVQRHDGRLRLTLIKTPKDQQQVYQNHDNEAVILDQRGVKIENKLVKEFDKFGIEMECEIQDDKRTRAFEKELTETRPTGTFMKQALPEMARGMINVHRSALVMKKLMGLENQNPTWSHRFNYAPAKLEMKNQEGKKITPLASLPPRPRGARLDPATPEAIAASLNAYEYFWRAKPAMACLKSPLTRSSPLENYTNEKVVAIDKPKAYRQQELQALRNCREARRSLLTWEAYCIATT